MGAGGSHRILVLGPGRAVENERLKSRGAEFWPMPDLAALLDALHAGEGDLVLLSDLDALAPVLGAVGLDNPIPVAVESEDGGLRRRALDAGAVAAFSPRLDPEEWSAQIGALLRLREKGLKLAESKRELERLSITDDLTGLHNKRWLLARLAEEISRAERYRDGVALILMDLDHFKRINDAQGHLFGDKVLVAFSELLLSSFRTVDRVARYGGEEFAVVLPETSLEGGLDAAERFRLAVEATPMVGMAITVSAGVTAYTHDDGEGEVQALLRQADEALYHAKRNGRNRVIATHLVSEAKAASS